MLNYAFVERPGIEVGKRCVEWLWPRVGSSKPGCGGIDGDFSIASSAAVDPDGKKLEHEGDLERGFEFESARASTAVPSEQSSEETQRSSPRSLSAASAHENRISA